MRLRSWHVAVLVAVVIFGTIAGTSIAGVWQTKGSQAPRRFGAGRFADSYDPADIRGSYSFGSVEAAFGIPVEVLARAFGVQPEGAALFTAKDLEENYGEIDGLEVGTDSLRLFVALYLDLPYEPEITSALPQGAYRLLSQTSSVDPDRLELYESRIVRLPEFAATTTGEPGTTDVPASDHEATAGERFIRGRTTFADLIEWGLTREQIERVIGVELPARGTIIRDFAAEQDVGFGTYRNQFQSLLDGLE